MEATAEKLEIRFKEADASIDLLSRKLSVEFCSSEDQSDEKSSNPGEMLQKLSGIKKEYADIVKEAQAIKEAQEEAMKFFKDELQNMCVALTKLQTNSGMQASGTSSEEMSEISKMLGIPVSEPVSMPSASASTPPEAGDFASPQSDTASNVAGISAPAAEPQESPEACISPCDKRKSITEFLALSKAEFESVSDLVRGRVKLPEVNQTYSLLWQHFKEEGNREPLTSQQMFKMGLRVTGQTGEAKLKVLRSLKLLKIMKNGAVLLT